ncbi:MAG: PBP1A family penicillin-binding protein [Actinobacteria bacterium]|nr:PBP1A family penicillin-binding protein [Cyanobacteriota bacterium]MCL5772230.1 PBP1A family penicillin-binding protein [Actinomycetota bacterium]
MKNNKKIINSRLNRKSKSIKGCFFGFFIAFIIVLCFILLVGGLFAFYYYKKLPKLENLTPSPIAETSKVYAVDGSLLTEFHASENREIIPFDKMSQNIKNAVVAIEDKRFYTHSGVDYKRIIGALITDIRNRNYSEGASTITQQYVKNIYFSQEKTLKRKINEAILAIQIERNYTKDKILEMYLNTVNFGAGSYGIEKAAQTYFGVSANDLSISQAALLAGLLRAPEVYSPFNNLDKAIDRRNTVLELMKEQGFIDEEQYKQAIEDPVVLNSSANKNNEEENRFAPFFIDYVKQQLYDKKFTDFDVFKGGLRIYTTLDKDLQIKAENSFKNIFKKPIGPSYALVCVDSNNGYIYAIVGGKDYKTSKFNIATQGKRQPGSVFKVPVLLESIIKNIPPETTFNPNGPITIDIPGSKPWIVDNYGGEKFQEPLNPMNIVDATIHSVNVVYAQLIMKVGAKNVEKLLNDMNISDIGSNPAIALGGLEKGITPLDVSKIFTTIASGGIYHEPVCILKITDSKGNILYEYDPVKSPTTKRIFEEPQAFLVTQILQKVITEGTGKAANIGRPAAGKTGTTSDLRDAWFAGYTPELTTIVWMGYQESNKAMEPINKIPVTGGAFPAKIWADFMKNALKGKPIVQFKTPENGLTKVQVCKDSGMLPTFWCPPDRLEYRLFVKGMAPTKYCNIHNKITVPELVGVTADEARQALQGLYFNINEVTENNNEYDSGIVFKTDPPGGTTVEAIDNINPQITIYISMGKQTLKMPNLIGQTKDTAESILSGSGIKVSNIVYDFSNQPPDIIFNQNPSPDSDIDINTQITIYISKGINPSGTVPDVIGMSKNDAVSSLNNAGFTNINFIEDQNSAAINTVFNQNPPAGTVYDKSKTVTISISKGIKVPLVTGLDKESAVKLLSSAGFIVEILPASDSNGKVTAQNPEANTYINFGSKVTITIETISTTTSATTTSSSSTSSSTTTSSTTTTSSSTTSSTTSTTK